MSINELLLAPLTQESAMPAMPCHIVNIPVAGRAFVPFRGEARRTEPDDDGGYGATTENESLASPTLLAVAERFSADPQHRLKSTDSDARRSAFFFRFCHRIRKNSKQIRFLQQDSYAMKREVAIIEIEGMSASLDRASHELSISLYDQGVGIPNTIHLSMFDPVKLREILPMLFNQSVDGSRIAAATELFRTGTQQSGRGKGFRNMKELVEVADNGELRVLSNRGFYHYVSQGSGSKAIESHGDHSLSIEGTLIEWRIRHAHQVVLEDE